MNMRQYETKALTLLHTTAGIETIAVVEEEVARLQAGQRASPSGTVDKLYPQESLDQVLALATRTARSNEGLRIALWGGCTGSTTGSRASNGR
jgi:hypothetical protein